MLIAILPKTVSAYILVGKYAKYAKKDAKSIQAPVFVTKRL